MSTIKRVILLGSLSVSILVLSVGAAFLLAPATPAGHSPQSMIIQDPATPLASPATLGAAQPLQNNVHRTNDSNAVLAKLGILADGDSLGASIEVLEVDRSQTIVIPNPLENTKSELPTVWNDPWEETVWVPQTYWKKVYHVEVYGTREVRGMVCFDGTPLPDDLTADETVTFVAEHGGGYSTGVVSTEVYLIKPAYVERVLMLGGSYETIRHEGYWSY